MAENPYIPPELAFGRSSQFALKPVVSLWQLTDGRTRFHLAWDSRSFGLQWGVASSIWSHCSTGLGWTDKAQNWDQVEHDCLCIFCLNFSGTLCTDSVFVINRFLHLPFVGFNCMCIRVVWWGAPRWWGLWQGDQWSVIWSVVVNTDPADPRHTL